MGHRAFCAYAVGRAAVDDVFVGQRGGQRGFLLVGHISARRAGTRGGAARPAAAFGCGARIGEYGAAAGARHAAFPLLPCAGRDGHWDGVAPGRIRGVATGASELPRRRERSGLRHGCFHRGGRAAWGAAATGGHFAAGDIPVWEHGVGAPSAGGEHVVGVARGGRRGGCFRCVGGAGPKACCPRG